MANNANEFAIELDKVFKEQVEDVAILILQKVAMEGLSRVVLKSPVDTGRFRGNWTVSIDQRSGVATDAKDKNGNQTIAAGSSVITGITDLRVVWLENNLPYAERIENGWSKQAPAGVVALTVAEIEMMFK